MIILGTRRKIVRLALLQLVCGSCGNPAAQALDRVVNRFTLFFVPLFPISTKHFLQCTLCGAGREVSKDEAAGLQSGGGRAVS